MIMLTNRQLQILQVIIDDFIATAQPVGSRQIAKKEGIGFSAATIRNEMADLEELGYLEKTHTSSGRVPSEKGYRFYVDHMLKPQIITNQDIITIQSLFQDRMMETEQVIRKSADILSELTTYTSIILGPDVQLHKVRRFSIVPISVGSAVAIIVTDHGHVENRLISIPENYSLSDIEKVVNILNERLVGVPLEQIHKKLEEEATAVIAQHIGSYDGLLTSIFDLNKYHGEGKIYYGGKTNMLKQPEFHDLNKVRMLMELMEKTSQIQTIFPHHQSGIQIRIGSENHHIAMEDCSVITATYSIGEEQKGSIAIIGPTRMDYRRVVSILDLMSSGLSRFIERH